MLELSIRLTAENEEAPLSVSLFRPDSGAATAPAPFEPPLGDPELADLRWYLETFSTWPTGPDYERAERIEAQLEEWGRDLLASVTAEREAARLWQQFVDAAPADEAGKLLTIDATDPRALRLPWELLADEGGHLFAQGVGVRRRLRQSATAPAPTFALPVRILVLVSRPDDAGFIAPRAVSRPLLDALADLGRQRVRVEFLYPPTLTALTQRLRDKKAPPVHVVHFDGHGVYDTDLGLGYLLFEDEQHRSDRVDANRLGTLLNRCGVPLMALNACQSAAQAESNPYASVAARLIRAGVGSVLAMNYSVLVTAAEKFVGAFYEGLAANLSIGQAVDEGRYQLLSDVQRHTLTRRTAEGELVEETVRLYDWFLPALYQQAADPVVFPAEQAPSPQSPHLQSPPPHSPTTQAPLPESPISPSPHLPTPQSPTPQSPHPPAALTDPTAPGGLPPEPRHGFHGRAREMLRLERALAEQPIVVLHGFGGLGKTALAAEAGRWFYRTGRFPGGAAFVSFEPGGSLAQLCSWVGQAISGDPNFVLGQGDPVERISRLLSERPALIILDNFESVLGRQPLMPAEELEAVLAAVWQWATGSPPRRGEGLGPVLSKVEGEGSRILITTRDTTFNDARFGPSKNCRHLELGGLGRADALALAAAVLADHGIDRAAIPRQDLVDLMARLGGHPLSLYLVLPHLGRHSPAELSARFEELLPGFTTGAAQERNESLAVSLEFSLRRLGEETRTALPDLAVFQGGCMELELLEITQIEPELWQTARTELEQAALVTLERLPGVEPPFLRFHPTLLPYLASRLAADRRAELQTRYWQRYYDLSRWLYKTDTQHPHQARAIAMRELPNLQRAFRLCLAVAHQQTSPPAGGTEGGPPDEGESEGQPPDPAYTAIHFADNIARFLDLFGRWRERDALLQEIGRLEIGDEQGLTKAEYLRLSRQGETLLQQGRAAAAEQLFRDLLARLEAGAAYEAAYDRAMTQARLGRCLKAQGQPRRAIDWHRQALAAFEPLSESNESAKEMLAACHVEWADNLAAVGQYDEAQQAYEDGLEVSREADDQRQMGVALGQLGTLALRRGDLAEAQTRYREALETFRALGEPQSEAVVWHQLGMVAEEAQAWDEAERCYREAVRIREQNQDLPGVARTCNQLARVAEGAGRLADAERWYLRAIALGEQLGDRTGLAKRLNNLANLYLGQGRLDEAEQYAQRAVAIVETLDLSAEPWKDYALQARIAEARGRAGEAAQWRRKEQESYAAYAGADHVMQQLQPLIQPVVAACQGDEEAKALLEPLLEAVESVDKGLAQAIHRILAGERDIERLREGLSRKSYVVVQTILARLAGEAAGSDPSPSPSPRRGGESSAETAPASPPEEEGMTIDDLLNLVAVALGPAAPAGLGEQLFAATQALAREQTAPPEVRALGRVLNHILSGDRQPDLSALPPELAAKIEALLGE